ncbi:MAG: protein-methionine-sulfoxide reductase catalytic subunit MsrP [Gammaproteobacteria bacterium]|nr:protein-methionine-sulfoxide reductase catalytic subunit MsrP [Gammaproteobacteria bacterium]NIM72425.1 protein-methionine-sulfoxide reductase catalytic subunit MsrP [Gammaproteobacteria bacterium]NIN37292.1 protein-methionine-sulfoxide reductase catalytic subunit MsrP [Gammaproteobacteria bacterium]NIO24182.1 protein-methionine-sulfoxide reductase catalytic subunit MsrP [Gammaproteobacteria bacterium]NIO64789.1 protein-methionine-sulfoxide reductase catalytic subunit MsrP [Gammaproteobacter
MLIRRREDIKSREITDESVYLNRRRFMREAAGITTASALAAAAPGLLLPRPAAALATDPDAKGRILEGVVESPYSTDEKLNRYKDITRYNNFYEFGTGKRDPANRSGRFQPLPWKVQVLGECAKPGHYDLDDIIKPHALEERIYRLRCVEAWSMVVPWVGVPLGPVLKRFEPTSKAKYVAFRTVFRPEQMPGQRRSILDWPYVEGLRIDEAMHPLTLLAVGLYGRALPNQNGAPIRLVVPWKYGFKSIKSVVTIRFTDTQPPTTWSMQLPDEYGFYSNVNPEVDHPRWSQSKERRIGEIRKRDTLMLNGYADQVASLYSGMDLGVFF